MTFFVQVDGLEWAFSNFPDESMPRPDTDGVLNIRGLCTVRSVAQRSCPGVYCTVAQRDKSFESAASSEQHSFNMFELRLLRYRVQASDAPRLVVRGGLPCDASPNRISRIL